MKEDEQEKEPEGARIVWGVTWVCCDGFTTAVNALRPFCEGQKMKKDEREKEKELEGARIKCGGSWRCCDGFITAVNAFRPFCDRWVLSVSGRCDDGFWEVRMQGVGFIIRVVATDDRPRERCKIESSLYEIESEFQPIQCELGHGGISLTEVASKMPPSGPRFAKEIRKYSLPSGSDVQMYASLLTEFLQNTFPELLKGDKSLVHRLVTAGKSSPAVDTIQLFKYGFD